MRHRLRIGRLSAFLVLSLVLVVVATACGGDDDATAETTIPPRVESTATTTATSTTATTPASSITAAPTPSTTIDTNMLASGSGCTPGADELPDGEWFGFVDSAAAVIDFDLACWFTGDAAVLAAAEDGEESPPPNDYYVRNDNPQIRSVPVSAAAEVKWLPNVGDPSTEETIAYAEWLSGRDSRGLDLQPGVWITVSAGEAIEVREQYVP